MTKRTLRQRIEKHEADAQYAEAKAKEWATKAERHRLVAQQLRKEAEEAATP